MLIQVQPVLARAKKRKERQEIYRKHLVSPLITTQEKESTPGGEKILVGTVVMMPQGLVSLHCP